MNQEDIKELQIMEQSLHSVLAQKQQFQVQLIELESSLTELEKTDTAYKIVGNIMISADKEELKKDLESKKELFSSRMDVLGKQEEKYRKETKKLQEELMKKIKK